MHLADELAQHDWSKVMTEPKLAVIVLAAGQGTRMRSSRPKVLHPLAGVSLIGHVLNAARALDPDELIVVVRHERDQVVEHVQELYPEARIVDQDELPGTGRAVEQALQALPEDFEGRVAILSGDVPMLDSVTLTKIVAEHDAQGSTLSVVSTTVKNPHGFGRILRDAQGSLDAIVEEKDADELQKAVHEINAGIYVANVDSLRNALLVVDTNNAQKEKYLTDAVKLIKRSGSRVEAFSLQDAWLAAGVNDRRQLSEVAAELNSRIIRKWQLAGVTIQDPNTTWIDQTVTLTEDVEILPGTQLLGATIVNSGAIIGPDTTLRDTEVGERARVIRTDSTLSVIADDCQVGPFAYLRPGTYLDAGGKIGTFVETKNSRIGAGSKVPHLTYVGDAQIGKDSNIGAGTIFANYDGQKKHHTEVGDGTKTGAHNTFVAPVTIGDGVYTAAGTVVRKNIPDGALGMTVAAQKNIEGWVDKNRASPDNS